VTRFASVSSTRSKVMEGFRDVLKRIVRCGLRGELWINGSFLTEKIDPPDIDCVAMIPSQFYDDGSPVQKDVIDWLQSKANEPKRLYLCDTSAELVYDENSPNHYMHADMVEYWQRTFGRSVATGTPKGIGVLRLDEVHL
jgi:hypothetical protein